MTSTTIGEPRLGLDAFAEHRALQTAETRRTAIVRTATRHANFAAWFGLGLGLTELAIPGAVARVVGAADGRGFRAAVRALGLRELTSSFGLLSGRRRARWMWARFVGDLMDLAVLGRAAVARRRDSTRLTAAASAVAALTALDAGAAFALTKSKEGHSPAGIQVRKTVTVNRHVEDLYRFWRDLENLPRFMAHLESVSVSGNRSHWKAKGPAHLNIEWDAEIVQDIPNELIAWRAMEGRIPNQGAVRFRAAPGNRGTEVHVHVRYDPPGGEVSAAVARLFGEEPGQQIAGDLRRFKQLMEAGDVTHSDASVQPDHPARPSYSTFPPTRGEEEQS